MSDIVDRLRDGLPFDGTEPMVNDADELMFDAADEIERLRAEVATSPLVTAIARLELHPGDRLLADVRHPIDAQTVADLSAAIRRRLPEGVELIVTSQVSFSVLAPGLNPA